VVQAARLQAAAGDWAFSILKIDPTVLKVSERLDEALGPAPGFSLFRRTSSLGANPTTQGVSLRGIAGSGASRVLITLDGVPQNDPFGGWVIWTGLPTETISAATLVRIVSIVLPKTGAGFRLIGGGDVDQTTAGVEYKRLAEDVVTMEARRPPRGPARGSREATSGRQSGRFVWSWRSPYHIDTKTSTTRAPLLDGAAATAVCVSAIWVPWGMVASHSLISLSRPSAVAPLKILTRIIRSSPRPTQHALRLLG